MRLSINFTVTSRKRDEWRFGPARRMDNFIFYWKVLFLVLAGAQFLYLTVDRRLRRSTRWSPS